MLAQSVGEPKPEMHIFVPQYLCWIIKQRPTDSTVNTTFQSKILEWKKLATGERQSFLTNMIVFYQWGLYPNDPVAVAHTDSIDVEFIWPSFVLLMSFIGFP